MKLPVDNGKKVFLGNTERKCQAPSYGKGLVRYPIVWENTEKHILSEESGLSIPIPGP